MNADAFEKSRNDAENEREVTAMSLSPELQNGLQALYGNCPEPVCAVDEALRTLWRNDACTEHLLSLTAEAVRASGNTPLLPMGEALFLRDGNAFLRCTAEPLSQNGETAYLLRFVRSVSPLSGHAAACSALSACAEEIRLTVSDALQSLADIYDALRSAQCAEGAFDATDRVLAACYRLLNQSLRCAEYAWYETAAAAPPVAYSIIDLGQTTQRLAKSLQTIAGDLMVIECSAATDGMTVCADRERLHFALLAIFLMAQNACCGDAVIRIRTEQTGDTVAVCMDAERLSDRKTNRVHRAAALPTDATAVSAQALVQRFCKQFRGTLLHRKTEQGCTVSLRLPYAGLPAHFTFRSPAADLPPSRYSSLYVMLSSVMDFRYGEEN